MNNHRRVQPDSQTPPLETAGRLEVVASAHSPSGDVLVRDLLVAGGLRGLTPAEMFEGAA